MGGNDAWGLRAAAMALAGIAGAALQLQQAALWPVAAYGVLLVAAAATCALARAGAGMRGPVLAAALACAMFAFTGLRAGQRLSETLPSALEG
jgi:competence protein ComEC